MHADDAPIKFTETSKNSVGHWFAKRGVTLILTFEGAPATGKSTIARALEQQGAVRIAEVNECYRRDRPESPQWYLERQIERWNEAKHQEARGKLVIIDGDVFQPIWYNWIYPERLISNWQENLRYFEKHLSGIGMPDQFILLFVDEEERIQREMLRSKMRGKTDDEIADKTEKYSDMHSNLNVYFTAIEKKFP